MSDNHTLRIGYLPDPVMATDCALDAKCRFRGGGIDAALIVCEFLHLNCIFELAYKEVEYGILVNGSWTGVMGDIISHRYDTSIPYFFPTDLRAKYMDFSEAYFYVEQIFITRTPEFVDHIDWSILFAFDWRMWIYILLCCLCISLLISAFDDKFWLCWRRGNFSEMQLFIVGEWFSSFKYMAGKGNPYKGYNRRGLNFIYTIWALASIVLSGAYTGLMFYQRMTVRNDLPYTDIESFVECIETFKCRLIVSPGQDYLVDRLVTASNLDATRLSRAFAANKPAVVQSTDDVLRRIRNDITVYWTTIDVKSYFNSYTNYNEACTYYTVEAPFKDMAAFPIAKNSTLTRRLNKAASLFQDNGLSIAIMDKYNKESGQCQTTVSSRQKAALRSKKRVSLTAARTFFIVYGLGICICTCVLGAEIFVQRTAKARRDRVTSMRTVCELVDKQCMKREC